MQRKLPHSLTVWERGLGPRFSGMLNFTRSHGKFHEDGKFHKDGKFQEPV
jgi:hypothetical protein